MIDMKQIGGRDSSQSWLVYAVCGPTPTVQFGPMFELETMPFQITMIELQATDIIAQYWRWSNTVK